MDKDKGVFMTAREVNMEIEMLKTVFDIVRLVDVSRTAPVNIGSDDCSYEAEHKCFAVWNKGRRCENCISAKVFARNFEEQLKSLDKMGAIAMIDVDNFKQINDSYGHVAGDAALCTIVRTIFEHVRADDVVLRYGGDEFLLMFEEIPEKVFQQKLEDIREEIAMADVPEYKEIRLSMSVGGVYGSCKVRDGVMEADRLLYQAKRQKNCVAYKRI